MARFGIEIPADHVLEATYNDDFKILSVHFAEDAPNFFQAGVYAHALMHAVSSKNGPHGVCMRNLTTTVKGEYTGANLPSLLKPFHGSKGAGVFKHIFNNYGEADASSKRWTWEQASQSHKLRDYKPPERRTRSDTAESEEIKHLVTYMDHLNLWATELKAPSGASYTIMPGMDVMLASEPGCVKQKEHRDAKRFQDGVDMDSALEASSFSVWAPLNGKRKLYVYRDEGNPYWTPQTPTWPTAADTLCIEAEVGDVLFFKTSMWHSGAENFSTEFTYCYHKYVDVVQEVNGRSMRRLDGVIDPLRSMETLDKELEASKRM